MKMGRKERIEREKKGAIVLLAAAISLCFLLSGCGQNAKNKDSKDSQAGAENGIAEYEFVSGYTVDIEPFGTSRVFLSGYEEVEIEGNVYQFDSGIGIEDRSQFISAQTMLCRKLADKVGQDVTGCVFRVFSEHSCLSDSDAVTGYFGLDCMNNWQQALATAQTVLGDGTNYGFLYALADDICGELGWTQDVREAVVDWTVFEKEPMMLSLVYPCFQKPYSTQEEIAAAKALSLELYDHLEILTEEAFAEEAEQYALEQQLAYNPTWLKFSGHGEYCPLRIRTKYLDIWIDDTYQTDAESTDGWEEDWLSTISLIAAKMEAADVRLSEIREKVGYDGNERVRTRFTHAIPLDGETERWGMFNGLESIDGEGSTVSILVSRYAIVFHEYAHYIFSLLADQDAVSDNSNIFLSNARTECFAQYYGIKEVIDSMVYKYGDEYYDRVYELSGIEAREPAGFIKLSNEDIKEDCEVKGILPKKLIDQENQPTLLLSVAGYIVQEYGETVFAQIMFHPGLAMELTGKTMDEILSDWSDDILN